MDLVRGKVAYLKVVGRILTPIRLRTAQSLSKANKGLTLSGSDPLFWRKSRRGEGRVLILTMEVTREVLWPR